MSPLDEEGIKLRLLQWARDRVADLEETVDLGALNPASEPAAGKRRPQPIFEKREVGNRGVSRAGHVVSVLFGILNLSFPIALLAGVAWALYRLFG